MERWCSPLITRSVRPGRPGGRPAPPAPLTGRNDIKEVFELVHPDFRQAPVVFVDDLSRPSREGVGRGLSEDVAHVGARDDLQGAPALPDLRTELVTRLSCGDEGPGDDSGVHSDDARRANYVVRAKRCDHVCVCVCFLDAPSLTLKEISRFSPPQMSMPASYVPISWK